ncbi:DUF4055 domain-containing protein [Endozoicomonas sp. SM1973]|uniref:DUF4055 domain-containing protein n=1 Tax=Spartinivicinus marinus TaxID=2994442 RepID=A0A853I8F7_9GAMM|nr:DUF4055 domain-containing protein [Spartinivicinus marinus]NYZ69119.1 DUF4055 domain-containing protein [Spartinivicinus marinus]
MPDVTFQHPEYVKAAKKWQVVEDVCAGENVQKYLRALNPSDTSKQNRERNEQYKKGAVYYNATGRTRQGLTGAVFKKVPVLHVPAALRYVEDDIDGTGVSIYQQSQKVLSEVLKKGRYALYVDYPAVSAPASKAQQAAGLIRASAINLSAERVINWRTQKVGASHLLSLVVIKESIAQTTEDGFGIESIEQYRVLRLDGCYRVEVWQQNTRGMWSIAKTYQPLNGKGQPWRFIPFTFIGAENNDTSIDQPPLLDLARLNLAHYQNSADYEDSAFFVGQAQPVISGLTEEWRDWMQQNGIYIGSRSPILLPAGGQFDIKQAQPNTMVKEAMDQKEQQMIALGARLLDKGSAVKTATEAQAENEAEHSVLSLAASNVSEAYTLALSWMANFMNAPADVEYTLNQEFTRSELSPQMLTALIQAWQSGRLPDSDLWAQLKKYGVIDPEKDDEDIKGELETATTGLALDDE